MEFKEVNVPEGIIEQIDHAGPFAGITVDVGNVDISYPNVNLDSSYEDTLDEINVERARYLLNTDEILEEKFGQTMV